MNHAAGYKDIPAEMHVFCVGIVVQAFLAVLVAYARVPISQRPALAAAFAVADAVDLLRRRTAVCAAAAAAGLAVAADLEKSSYGATPYTCEYELPQAMC